MESEILIGIILSSLLGAMIGTQRESRQQRTHFSDIAGFRSFTLLSLSGFLLTYLSKELFGTNLPIFIGLFAISLLLLSSYLAKIAIGHVFKGITSPLSGFITFIIGILVGFKLYYPSIVLAIILTTLLFFADSIHKFAGTIEEKEIFATLKFAIILFVILPILPNQNFSLLDIPYISSLLLGFGIESQILSTINIFNPYRIWLFVVLISAISYVGYIFMKLMGDRKGTLLTGFLGGLVSSTALTVAFASKSREMISNSFALKIAILIACSTMFFRVIFEVLIINPAILPLVFLPLFFMGVSGFLIAIIMLKRSEDSDTTTPSFETRTPFSLRPALTFAFFFISISFISRLFIEIFGSSGIYFIAFVSGFTDVDAITIALLQMAGDGTLQSNVAATGIILAASANTIVKGFLALYLGTKKLSYSLFLSLLGIVIIGVLVKFLF